MMSNDLDLLHCNGGEFRSCKNVCTKLFYYFIIGQQNVLLCAMEKTYIEAYIYFKAYAGRDPLKIAAESNFTGVRFRNGSGFYGTN